MVGMHDMPTPPKEFERQGWLVGGFAVMGGGAESGLSHLFFLYFFFSISSEAPGQYFGSLFPRGRVRSPGLEQGVH